jgi:fucose 4-O-acetylase-like acetyltransferase
MSVSVGGPEPRAGATPAAAANTAHAAHAAHGPDAPDAANATSGAPGGAAAALAPPRNVTLDVAKGLAIVHVAFWHSGLRDDLPALNAITQTYGIPLFFFLSGVFFKPQSGFLAHARSKADALLKPYVVTVVLLFVLARCSAVLGPPAALFLDSRAPLWFLPVLFGAELLAWGLRRAAGASAHAGVWGAVGVAALLGVGASLLHGDAAPAAVAAVLAAAPNRLPLPHWPWVLDLVPVACGWLLTGMVCAPATKDFAPRASWVLAALVAFAALYGFVHPQVDLGKRVYTPGWAATLTCGLSIYLVLSASSVLVRVPGLNRVLSYLGVNSLFIMCFQLCLCNWIGDTLDRYDIGTEGLARASAQLAVSIVLALGCGALVRNTALGRTLYLPRRRPRRAAPGGARGG